MDTVSKAVRLLGLKVGPETVSALGAEACRSGSARTAAASLVPVIRKGFPVATVQHLVNSGRLKAVEVDRVVLPRKTLANRKRMGALTAEQSDRLLRVARIIVAAEEAFGDAVKADAWLRRRTTALDGEQPIDLLDTEEGAREVETLLVRIGHGIAA